jgi:hypothetical protein
MDDCKRCNGGQIAKILYPALLSASPTSTTPFFGPHLEQWYASTSASIPNPLSSHVLVVLISQQENKTRAHGAFGLVMHSSISTQLDVKFNHPPLFIYIVCVCL